MSLRVAGFIVGFVLFLAAVAPLAAVAHPGVGIVRDSRGNVFYTDLTHVWRISPAGQKSIAVLNVHTHELCIDAEDNLFGEHLWYEGERTDRWGHRVWCLKRDGTLVDVIPAREGFLRDYSFVRDARGNMYWAERGTRTVIRKRAADGTTSILCDRWELLREVRQMTSTPDGTIYLVDGQDVRRIEPAVRSRRSPAT